MKKMNIDDFMNYVRDSYQPILNRDDVVLEDLYNVHSDVIGYIEGNWRFHISFDQMCELLEQEYVYYNLVVKELGNRGIDGHPKVADTSEFFKINLTYMALYSITSKLTPNEEEINKVINDFCPECIRHGDKKTICEYFEFLVNNPNYSRMFIS